jgi:3-oxoacyl-[acyl-carrier-protein] synthase-3
MRAFLQAIATHLPEEVITNEQLQAENPDWEMARIGSRTGIDCRHIAAENETAGDLAFAAGRKLLDAAGVDRAAIDYLLFCTQSPDYFLPATACVLQHRLGLPTTCGAIDFNQGCSGYVYGLHMARALVTSGSARNVLLLTGETYSKYIHPRDMTVRVLFGDAGTATLISAEGPGAEIGAACLGSDGSGARHLLVPAGAARRPKVNPEGATAAQQSVRTEANLFMDGKELLSFALNRVPGLVEQTLEKNRLTADQVEWYVFHQANAYMNQKLGQKLGIAPARMPMYLKEVGNTVSNTIPLTLANCGAAFRPGETAMLAGFGVGYSWAACTLKWAPIVVS